MDAAHASRPFDTSATEYSYSRPAHKLHPADIGTSRHAANLSTEPYAGFPIGHRRAYLSLTVSAPNSSPKHDSLQNPNPTDRGSEPMPIGGFARRRLPGVGDVIIPVKNSAEESDRWAGIWGRFALSHGNMIRIMGAEVDFNRNSGYPRSVVWPLNDLGPLGDLSPGIRIGLRCAKPSKFGEDRHSE